MADMELFNEVLKRFEEQYSLTVERPYPYYPTIIQVKNEAGRVVGEMNTEGYNLLFNLKRLCDMLEDELR